VKKHAKYVGLPIIVGRAKKVIFKSNQYKGMKKAEGVERKDLYRSKKGDSYQADC